MSRLYLSNPCSLSSLSHTVLRAQSAPGLPCALSMQRATEDAAARARSSRGDERVCVVIWPRTQLSSRRRPGPIRRGGNWLARWWSAFPQQDRPVVTGPGLRRDDTSDEASVCVPYRPLLIRAPGAPAHILQASEIRAQRAAGLPGLALVAADAFFALRDLALELDHRFLHVAELVVLAQKARHFQRLQRFAVLL